MARYLEGRGLSLPAEPGRVLRYHPACPFGPGKLPAMLALIRKRWLAPVVPVSLTYLGKPRA